MILNEQRMAVWRTFRAMDDERCLKLVIQAAVLCVLMLCPWRIRGAGIPRSIANQFLVNVWQTEEGLPQNSVTAIAQTRDGYLWLGTFNGLVRFDGVRFVVFEPGTNPALLSSRILVLGLDHTGALWIGTEGGGLSCYRNGEFKTYTTKDGLLHNVVSALCEDHRGNLWIGTDGGLNVFRDGKFAAYTRREGLANDRIESVVLDREGNIWCGTSEGLSEIPQGKQSLVSFPLPLAISHVTALAPSQSGGFWIATMDGTLRKFKDGQFRVQIERSPWSRGQIKRLYEDRKGHLWIGTYGRGLFQWREGEFVSMTSQEGLSHDIIWSIYEDLEGSLWIGTNGGGLNRLKERFFAVYGRKDGLTEDLILSLCEGRSGDLWIGTNCGGLDRLKDGNVLSLAEKDGLANTCVWSVFEDKNGVLWIGTWGGGVFRFQDGKFTRYRIQDGLSSEVVLAIYQDHEGNLWFGTNGGGLNRYENGHFVSFTSRDGLSHDDVRAIHQDDKGNLWIGTNGGGLNRFKDGKFKFYTKKNGLCHDNVWSLYEDAEGALWIGTFGGGLSRLKDDQFTNYTTKNGLSDNVICSIVEDGLGYLWMSSYRGIFRVSKNSLTDFAEGKRSSITCISYGKADGLASRECNGGFQPASAKTRDGRLWFPTLKGIAIVEPAQLILNEKPPPVLLEELLVDGQAVSLTNRARIQAGKEKYEFHYTGLSLVSPEKVKFKFKLDGLDPNWVNAEERRVAYYTHIPPGHYQFRVTACNNDGIWNLKGASITFTVLPPVWQTWWFLALAALIATGSIGGTVRYVLLKNLQRKLGILERERALDNERARIAKDMHDQLGASLTKVALLSEIGQRDVLKPEATEERFRKISEMAREVVQAMDEIVWVVNPKNDTLNKLIEYLCQFADEYFQDTPIRCWQEIPEVVPADPLPSDVRHNLYLVFKEALNNIVKHADAKEVWIAVSLDSSAFEIVIRDNGRGISDPTPRRAGNGLSNMRKRLEDIGGRFELESQPNLGTKLKMKVAFRFKK